MKRNLMKRTKFKMLFQAEWERVLKPSIMDAFLSYIPEKVRAVEILGILRESIVPYIIRVVPEKLVLSANSCSCITMMYRNKDMVQV